MTVLGSIAAKFSSSVAGYLNLWAYIDKRAKHRLTGGATHRLSTAHEFHAKLFRGEIKHGDLVVWDRIYLSDWLPRFAGGWSLLAILNKWDDDTYLRTSETEGSRLMAYSLTLDRTLPPLGAVRLPLQPGRPRALGGVTAAEYAIEQGVVFSVSESVYQVFLSKRWQNNTVEASLARFIHEAGRGCVLLATQRSLSAQHRAMMAGQAVVGRSA